MDCYEWSAWYNRMPGQSDPNLHVAGKCSAPSTSVVIELVPANEGTVDEPDLYVLELRVHEPQVGDTQVIEREVVWEDDVGQHIERVRIQGAVDVELEVTIAE